MNNNTKWTSTKDGWTSRRDIVGAFAMWACRQSPYGVPDNLELVCKRLYDGLAHAAKWGLGDLAEVSLNDIEAWIPLILADCDEYLAWNKCKVGTTPEFKFVDAYSNSDADYDFIDLGALCRNVCLTISKERDEMDASCAGVLKSLEEDKPAIPLGCDSNLYVKVDINSQLLISIR